MYALSKSKLMSALQCAKRLYLEVHEPQLAAIDSPLSAQFAAGLRVGEVARSLYPEGRLIGDSGDAPSAVEETRVALATEDDLLLFEPSFVHGGVLVRADLLFRRAGRYRLVEVKATTGVEAHHYQDVAIQAWVIDGAGYTVDGVSIAHVDNTFVYPGGGDYRGLLKSVDVTAEMRELIAQAPELAFRCQQIIAGSMPGVAVGKQCHEPYECPFTGHCNAHGPEYPLSILGRHRTLRDGLIAQGYRDLRDVPEDAIGDGRPRQLWEATRTGRVSVDPAAATLLRGLGYPRYYLDFETIQFAVPIWAGTRPYEQLPFQWACIVEHQNGSIEHREFLDTSGDAPMRACAEALIAALATEGPVFAYTGFEARIIGEAAARYGDLAPQLYALIGRIVDLHELARSYYYHPAQKGSWSLKAVVPTIAAELDYGGLSDVTDGTSAQLAYFDIIDRATPEQRRNELIAALRVYCRRDTEAMMKLVGRLQGG